MKLEAVLDKAEGELAVRVQVGRNLFAEIAADAAETDKIDAIIMQFGEQEVTSLRVDDARRLEIRARLGP